MKSVVRQLWEPNKIGGNLNTGKIKAKRKSHNKYIVCLFQEGHQQDLLLFWGMLKRTLLTYFPFLRRFVEIASLNYPTK